MTFLAHLICIYLLGVVGKLTWMLAWGRTKLPNGLTRPFRQHEYVYLPLEWPVDTLAWIVELFR